MELLSLETLLNIGLSGVFVLQFLLTRDLVHKQLALFTASYFLFVVFSEQLFGLQFSSKSNIFGFGIDTVTPLLVAFWGSFYFASNIRIGKNPNGSTLCPPQGLKTSMTTIILAIPFILFMANYFFSNGIRVTGSFLDFRGVRSVSTDYVFVYYAVLVAIYRKSRFLLVVGLFAALVHILSGERLRAFVYIILIAINYYGLEQRRHTSSAFLLFGFVFATLIGQLRTGSFVGNQDYNITHFGSVTVSSLYLLDFGTTLDAFDKFRFIIGTVLSNLIPSSLVPLSYNIRTAIFDYAAIPGGGWLPAFIQVQAGIAGVIVTGFGIGKSYSGLLAAAHRNSTFQQAFYAATLVFIATTPRWFMYTPFQLVKMPLYAFVLCAIFIVLGRFSNNKGKISGA